MRSLAIVDDRKEMRTTVQRQIEMLVDGAFRVFESPPLPSALDYPSWVIEEDIAGLVLDERLNEQKGGSKHVTYTGHEVVDVLHRTHAGLPIFVLTAFPSDDALVARINAVDLVMDKRTFTTKPAPYVARMMKAAGKFEGEHEAMLLELGELAEAIAAGTASVKAKTRAKQLQKKLNIYLPIQEITERSEWLAKAEAQLTKVRRVRATAERAVRMGTKK